MIGFKVLFKNNKPAFAKPLDISHSKVIKPVKATWQADRRVVDWLVVYSDNEQQAILNAKQVYKEYFGAFPN